jgi:hypothetical protein
MRLGEAGFLERRDSGHTNYNKVYASSLQHDHLRPETYLGGVMLKQGSLAHFIATMRRGTTSDPEELDRLWERVRADPLVHDIFNSADLQEIKTEHDISLLLGPIIALISERIGIRNYRLCGERCFGQRGLVAFEKSTLPQLEPNAAYLGRSDITLEVHRAVIAAFELKIFSESDAAKPWYVRGSTLPQIMCWMGGSPTCKAGFVVTNLGFKVIYREMRNESDADGNPIFDYYYLPSSIVGREFEALTITVGDSSKAGITELVRALFEILASQPSAATSTQDHQMRESWFWPFKLWPCENTNTDNLHSCKDLFQVKVSSYSIALNDGTLLGLQGLQFPARFKIPCEAVDEAYPIEY